MPEATYKLHQRAEGWYIPTNFMGRDTKLEEGGGPYATKAEAEAAIVQFEKEDAELAAKENE